ncbi:MAG TPA: ribonuclease domain-containing protein [Streptosporangiaceae bacterium]
MQSKRRSRRFRAKRLAVALVAVASLSGIPAVTSPAHASVHTTCTISRCPDAVSANSIWSAKGYPTSRGWYNWPNGQCSFAGGQYQNREMELPLGDLYYEYDVYPRSCGAARDAYRIVVDFDSGSVWFTPNHYTDFYQL